jgi:formamidopyrimidine-DNA glycosylase
MPELPEVETVANSVNSRVRSQRILSVWLSRYKELFKTPRAEMADALPGMRIERVRREGKHIVFNLSEEKAHGANRETKAQWIVHLGMTGRLLVSPPEVPRPDHTHAVLALSGGGELRFVDARRFGRVAFYRGAGFQGPGREPLTISPQDFVELFHGPKREGGPKHGGRKLSIKAALLNQKLLHGVGNIYADESLFRAGIRPTSVAGRLSRTRLVRLHAAVQEILRKAIERGGSSVSDYVDADGVAGFFQLEHKVYMRTGEPCVVCGRPIQRTVLAGRGTHFCAHCQT